jgi:hypothetical protein
MKIMHTDSSRTHRPLVVLTIILASLRPATTWADGKLVKPRNYQGSLEEKAQEAIIIFEGS